MSVLAQPAKNVFHVDDGVVHDFADRDGQAAQRERVEAHAEGPSRLTYQLEQIGESVKLTVIHEMDRPDSKLIGKVSNGWPHILASLKSLLETGEALAETRHWPRGI